MTDYVTVEGVEILSAGRTWKGQTGVYYVTAEHLADMVAAQADPLIRSPRVKLGHCDVFFGALAGSHDPSPASVDGQPGFGKLVNLRLDEAGAKLIADMAEVPDWLAEAMPSAYATRSAEWIWTHETAGGKKYSAVLTDVSLGGTWRPAVEDLADITREQAAAALKALLHDGPAAAEAVIAPSARPPEARMPEHPAASVSVDRIVGLFHEWADGEPVAGLDTAWWWARDVRVDPDEIIASDGEGGTYRVPFTTDGEHDATFGEPVLVRDAYIDVAAPAAAASAAQARIEQRVLAHDLPRPTDRPAKAASAAPTQEEPTMDVDTSLLRRRLGLPEDATDEQITEALTTEPEEAPAAGVPEEEVEQRVETAVAAAREEERAKASASHEDGRTVTVDREQWQRTQDDAAAGRAAHDQQTASARDTLIDEAVKDGRIAPASRQAWRDALDKQPEAEAASLAALTPNRIPVSERGFAGATETTTDTSEGTGWFASKEG